MLRAKRRRTRMHDKEGNPIFNTKNGTVKQNHYEMKNNYLSYLKTKQNPNLGCKKYYSQEEIEEIHNNNILDTKLTVNVGNSILDPDKNCSPGLLAILVPIPNTKDFSGDYTYYNRTTYYIDEIKTFNYLGIDIPIIMFMTYIGNIPFGTWCIFAVRCIPPKGSSVILKKPIDNVNMLYKLYLSNDAQYKIKIENITSFCWAFYIIDELGLPITLPNLELYYNRKWTIGTQYGEKNKTVNIQITPDEKHKNAIIIKNKLLASKYCKTKSVPRNPLQGYRKQLITKHNHQITKAIQLSLNITDKSIIGILKQIGLDYFNTPINFSGDYELVNDINKEINLKDRKFNLAYKQINTKNKNDNYEIGYFYEKTPIGNFSFNGWVLRYYNVENENIFIDYFYFVEDNDKNRLFLNALDNFTRTIFAIRTKNEDVTYVNKGFFCFIDPNTCNIINNADNINLKDTSNNDKWEGTVYDKRLNTYSNQIQFYVGGLPTTSQTTFPYSIMDITINSNNELKHIMGSLSSIVEGKKTDDPQIFQ